MGDEARGRSAARRRPRHLVVGKTKVAVGLAQQGDEARDFALHVLLAAEYMRVVLLERARPHDAVDEPEGSLRWQAPNSRLLKICTWHGHGIGFSAIASSPSSTRNMCSPNLSQWPLRPQSSFGSSCGVRTRRSRLGASCAGHSPPAPGRPQSRADARTPCPAHLPEGAARV
jgi:hypothetical protein